MPKVIMRLHRSVQCGHCKKIIGCVVIRTVEVKGDLFTDSIEVECPRPECGKLLGHLDIIFISH